MKTKIILLLVTLFLIINTFIYILTHYSSQNKIDFALKDNLKILTTHYKILLEKQRKSSRSIYENTIAMNEVIEIMSQAKSASKEKKAQLRAKIHNLLSPVYKRAKKIGVLQYHFMLPNNESFYRAHKPSKFGDNIANVRADIKYTNETKKPIRGFTQGRTAHGFRNTFPLFDKNHKHIGAMEISFSSDSFQWYLNNISGIHSHFIVNKKIFDAKAWARDDLVLKYTQSAIHNNYMLTLGDIHTKEECIVNNRKNMQPIRSTIDSKILLGKAFSVYTKYYKDHNRIDIISFLPIKNIDSDIVAWIVSYEESPIIMSALYSEMIARVITFFISLLIIYFLIKQILSKQEIKKQHKILNDILNLTDNIIFVTDFKDVKYSNNKFKELLNIKDIDILNLFTITNGYLHKGLLVKDEKFVSLISRTDPKDRIVSILDKNNDRKAFKISILESEGDGDYLVSLSDITIIKKQQVETEKKAYFDGLTQVYNRNKFDELLKEELNSDKRDNNPLSVAIIDIDNFKSINDLYGHLIGDDVLKVMAQTVNNYVRDTDIFTRWGGDEFVILFSGTTAKKQK